MPPRSKSTRSRGPVSKTTVTKTEDLDAFVDSGDNSEPGPRNYKKTRKSTKSTTKSTESNPASWQRPRGRGKLKMLPEMPLDILFEIFSTITPLDLLHLSRATKALRVILMSRTSVTVWRAAFTFEPELSGIPKDLTEPKWANLVFSKHCHHCLSPGDHYVLVAFRTRTCANCVKEHYGSLADVTNRMKGKLICKRTDLLHRVDPSMKYGSGRAPRSLWSYADAKSVNLQLARMKTDKDALEAYKSERLKCVESERFFSIKYEESISSRNGRIRREARERQLKVKQRAMIRLEDLGYGEEVERLNEADPTILSEHISIIKFMKDPTDRVWTKGLPPLIEFMEEIREKLQKKQRKSLLRQRLRIIVDLMNTYANTRPPIDPLPGVADLCCLPQVKEILENTSPDAYTNSESFAKIQVQLPSLCEGWVSSKKKELLALMPRVVGTHNNARSNDISCLELATTFFKCSECLEPISYPRILVHNCLTTLKIGNRNREDDIALMFSVLDAEPWNFDGTQVKFFPGVEASSKGVIQACGFTPDIATAADLNNMGRWLECLHCSHPAKGRAVFKWQTAILHDMNHVVADNKSALWLPLTDEEAKIARSKQDQIYSTHRSEQDDFVCLRCRKVMQFSSLKLHVRYEHDIETLQADDYCLHLDAPIQPPFSVMMPHKPQELGPSAHLPGPATVAGPTTENDVIDLVTPSLSDVEGIDGDDDFYI